MIDGIIDSAFEQAHVPEEFQEKFREFLRESIQEAITKKSQEDNRFIIPLIINVYLLNNPIIKCNPIDFADMIISYVSPLLPALNLLPIHSFGVTNFDPLSMILTETGKHLSEMFRMNIQINWTF
jgi:hypothetical protein